MSERKGAVTFKGDPLTLVGPEIKPGARAPDFKLVANDLSEVTLGSTSGSVRIFSVVPSLDTPVCETQTKQFNQEATELGDDVRVLTISVDLPFAQKRFCGAAGIDRVQTLSDHRDTSFGRNYGVLVKELRLLGRAVFVVDRDDVVRYVQYVPEITELPDYDAAVKAARDAL